MSNASTYCAHMRRSFSATARTLAMSNHSRTNSASKTRNDDAYQPDDKANLIGSDFVAQRNPRVLSTAETCDANERQTEQAK